MAQEITHWCDPHFKGENQDRRPVVFSGVIKIGELERFTELCADCFKTVTKVAAMIEEHGVRPDLNPEPATTVDHEKPHKCPRCPKRYSARTSLGNHSRDIHGMSLIDLERQEGITRTAEVLPCGIDGCAHVSASPQGLGAHRKSKHGVTGKSSSAIKNREQKKLITRRQPQLVAAS